MFGCGLSEVPLSKIETRIHSFFFFTAKPIIEIYHFPERKVLSVWEDPLLSYFPKKGGETHIFSRKLSHVIYFTIRIMCSNILNVKAYSLLRLLLCIIEALFNTNICFAD